MQLYDNFYTYKNTQNIGSTFHIFHNKQPGHEIFSKGLFIKGEIFSAKIAKKCAF